MFGLLQDGSGGWENSDDTPTVGESNEGEIPALEICTDLANDEFVSLYAENTLNFTGDYQIEVQNQATSFVYSSGLARTFTTPTSLDTNANIQGGVYEFPSLSPATFPSWISSATFYGGNWNSGDYVQAIIMSSATALGGTYHVTQLILQPSQTLYLNQGDYYITQLILQTNSRIIALEDGVNIYIDTTMNLGLNSSIQSASGNPQDIRITQYPVSNFTAQSNSQITGNIITYGDTSNAFLESGFSLHGSLISEGNIEITGDITIIHDSDVVASQELLFGCSTPPVSNAAYFKITTTSSALTCAPQPVTISAHAADDSQVADYTGTISLQSRSLASTNTGDWLDSSQVVLPGNGTTDDGWTSVDFTLADGGSRTLFLSETHKVTVNLDILDSVLSISESPASDSNITFSEVGFQWLDATNAPLPSPAVPYLTAGTSQDVIIRAVTTDPATGQCTNLFADTTDVSLSIGSLCLDPASCYAGQRISATNNGNTFDLANPENLIAGQPITTQLMRFSSNSTTSLELTSPDVGEMQLDVTYDLLDAGGTTTGETISGSVTIVSRPDHLSISGIQDTSGNINPATQTAAGGTANFVPAGELFHLQVEGKSSTDVITPSFGRESTLPQPVLTPTLVAPLAGSTGSMAQTGSWIASTTDGALTFANSLSGVSYSEVGAINATAELSDYMGPGIVTGVSSEVIGRFTPARFDVTINAPILSAAQASCGFVYRGQDLLFNTAPLFTITALNTAGVITTNYDQEFFTLPSSLNMAGVQLSDSGTAWVPSMTWSGQWVQGAGYDGIVGLQIDSLNLSRSSIPTLDEAALLNPAVQVSLFDSPLSGSSLIHDADGICYSPSSVCSDYTTNLVFSGIQWLYGRTTLTNNYGAETRDLSMPVNIEYWDGSYWQPQLSDSCTNFLSTDFSLGTWVVETADPLTFTPITISSWSGLLTGAGQIILSAPGAGNTGTLPVTLNVPTYLQFHWDDDYLTVPACVIDSDLCLDNPTATAKFGIYEGRAPVLYRYQLFR